MLEPHRDHVRFSLLTLLIGPIVCAAIGALIGGAAAVLQIDLRFAPVLLFPVLIGGVLGMLLAGLMRYFQVAHTATVLLCLAAAGCAVVGSQHYVSFWRICDERAEQKRIEQKAREAFPDLNHRLPAAEDTPDNFPDFLRGEARRGRAMFYGWTARGPWAWASWALDGLIVLGVAAAVVLPALRLPYCSSCNTWYRPTRTGRLAIANAQRLAECAGVEIPERVRSVRYRFLTCASGCGPTGLELLAKVRAGGLFSVRVWLDGETRNRATQIVDEILAEKHKRPSQSDPSPED